MSARCSRCSGLAVSVLSAKTTSQLPRMAPFFGPVRWQHGFSLPPPPLLRRAGVVATTGAHAFSAFQMKESEKQPIQYNVAWCGAPEGGT